MAFIDNFKRYCGGSAALAWLLTVTVAAGLLLWILSVAGRWIGFPDTWISQWLALSANPVTVLTRPWTLATYMVTHLSPLHLLFNTLWLFWFGQMLADVSRERTIIILFAGGGVFGGIVYILMSWITDYSPASHLTGDSAAVMSVMTAIAVIMPDRRIRLFLFGEIKLKWIAIVCIAITLLGANGSGIPPQSAHIAGIVFGLIWALDHKSLLTLPKFSSRRPQTSYNHKINTRATIKAINNSISDEERLDQLLDKIRISGYDSLSNKEKTELNHISNRLRPPINKK